jgi:hypothetical protein
VRYCCNSNSDTHGALSSNRLLFHNLSCDYIGHPRPSRFLRAMKQIYQPAYVLSHFVHYSTVTKSMAEYYRDIPNHIARPYRKHLNGNDNHERLLDELSEGVLIHTKSLLPHETTSRTTSCSNASKNTCVVGYVCPKTTRFDDLTHTLNIFHDDNGKYCNCWVDDHVETYWVPLLETALKELT